MTSLTINRGTVTGVAVATIVLPLYALSTTMVGLNGDLNRYGIDGLQLVCGSGQRVWANYRFEPFFVAVWFALAKAWAVLFASGSTAYCSDPGLQAFWMPVFAGAVLIAVQIVVVRHLGASAVAFHLVFCLDTLLMMLPFNLIRQFIATTVVLGATSLLVRGRLSPRWFTALLIVPALIHWSGWMLVGLALIALIAAEAAHVHRGRSPGRWQTTAVVIQVVVLVAATASLAGVFLIARVGDIALANKVFERFTVEAAVRGLVSPITLTVIIFAVASSRAVRDPFLRVFLAGAGMMYFLGAASGHVPLMERLRAMILPMTLFIFLYALRRQWLAPRWHAISVCVVAFSVVNFTWHALVLEPFAGRPSFTRLFDTSR